MNITRVQLTGTVARPAGNVLATCDWCEGDDSTAEDWKGHDLADWLVTLDAPSQAAAKQVTGLDVTRICTGCAAIVASYPFKPIATEGTFRATPPGQVDPRPCDACNISTDGGIVKTNTAEFFCVPCTFEKGIHVLNWKEMNRLLKLEDADQVASSVTAVQIGEIIKACGFKTTQPASPGTRVHVLLVPPKPTPGKPQHAFLVPAGSLVALAWADPVLGVEAGTASGEPSLVVHVDPIVLAMPNAILSSMKGAERHVDGTSATLPKATLTRLCIERSM
jgi:hypothetical protein